MKNIKKYIKPMINFYNLYSKDLLFKSPEKNEDDLGIDKWGDLNE